MKKFRPLTNLQAKRTNKRLLIDQFITQLCLVQGEHLTTPNGQFFMTVIGITKIKAPKNYSHPRLQSNRVTVKITIDLINSITLMAPARHRQGTDHGKLLKNSDAACLC